MVDSARYEAGNYSFSNVAAGSYKALVLLDEGDEILSSLITVEQGITARPDTIVLPLQDDDSPNGFTVAPNPTLSRFAFHFELDEDSWVELMILKMNLGSLETPLAGVLPAGEWELVWGVSETERGLYWAQLTVGSRAPHRILIEVGAFGITSQED